MVAKYWNTGTLTFANSHDNGHKALCPLSRHELAQKFYANVLDRDRSRHDWILDD